jgi:hypothetical protein
VSETQKPIEDMTQEELLRELVTNQRRHTEELRGIRERLKEGDERFDRIEHAAKLQRADWGSVATALVEINLTLARTTEADVIRKLRDERLPPYRGDDDTPTQPGGRVPTILPPSIPPGHTDAE